MAIGEDTNVDDVLQSLLKSNLSRGISLQDWNRLIAIVEKHKALIDSAYYKPDFGIGSSDIAEGAIALSKLSPELRETVISKLTQVTTPTDHAQVYVKDQDGTQIMKDLSTSGTGGTVAQRAQNGQLRAADPEGDQDCVTKGFLDTYVAQIVIE